MSRPSSKEVSEFAYHCLWDSVFQGGVADRFSARSEFSVFLKARGFAQIIAEEFAESNIGLLLTKVLKVCGEWEALGIPSPLHVVDQEGTMVTWKHPNYETISGRTRLSEGFCDVWQWVKGCRDREFLFCCAAYLFQLGCSRIYVTDTTGDAGLDLIGIHEGGPFRGMCFAVQAKTAAIEVGKESLFSDYTKFLLLRYNIKWDEYQRATGIDKACDGVGLVYIFASNQEFNPAIVQAARDLPIMLRSGRQIAHDLAKRADLKRWMAVRDQVGEANASTTRNLQVAISKAL
jgi:hypothetical protein